MIETTRSALMREIRAGARGARLIDDMKKMRKEKDSRIEEVLRQNFGATNNDLCNRCAVERMQDTCDRFTPTLYVLSSRKRLANLCSFIRINLSNSVKF